MAKITKDDIDKAVRGGEMIVTTKEIIKEAVKECVSGLYDDVSDFAFNRYMTSREFEQISEKQKNDIADDVIDYILGE
ncbi:MAG: hypothetical protein ACOCWG_04815 [bacterium]